jgi:hypothetical protein
MDALYFSWHIFCVGKRKLVLNGSPKYENRQTETSGRVRGNRRDRTGLTMNQTDPLRTRSKFKFSHLGGLPGFPPVMWDAIVGQLSRPDIQTDCYSARARVTKYKRRSISITISIPRYQSQAARADLSREIDSDRASVAGAEAELIMPLPVAARSRSRIFDARWAM